jgi:hypothetical protein
VPACGLGGKSFKSFTSQNNDHGISFIFVVTMAVLFICRLVPLGSIASFAVYMILCTIYLFLI